MDLLSVGRITGRPLSLDTRGAVIRFLCRASGRGRGVEETLIPYKIFRFRWSPLALATANGRAPESLDADGRMDARAEQSKEKSMSTRVFSSQLARCFFAALAVSV